MKVLFHVDFLEKWQLALKNVLNIIEYAKKNDQDFEIAVVANWEAVIQLSVKTAKLDLFEEVESKKGKIPVEFLACGNALTGFGVDKADLMPFVKVVPAGVVEIAQRQANGYSYIKP